MQTSVQALARKPQGIISLIQEQSYCPRPRVFFLFSSIAARFLCTYLVLYKLSQILEETALALSMSYCAE